MTSDDYTPDTETTQLFARYKKAREAEKKLLAEVKAAAPAQLHAGATTAQLAKLTGLSDEVFRRIARAEGVERKREPTVGSLKPTDGPVANPRRTKGADPQD
ncbi:hypothetical protein [Kitasatospora mediocidica]|uniref:hypothetical protein n=1 Tax=Kitasatospora mediocidica TaxID=58352 RepID=UPI00056A4A64|nr:hypothetical protein [Kitasatospora mediocidica]